MPQGSISFTPSIPGPTLARLSVPQRILVLVYLLVAVAYLTWRPNSFNPDAMVFSLLVYGAELFGFVCAGLYLFMCWTLRQRCVPEVPAGMSADVFVPTLNESVDILRRTLMAALRMEHVGEVWLLDDGDREEMRGLAQQLGCKYIARADRTHAKAGNINNALQHCDAEYIALFDADHAPAPNFLKQTLGFFDGPQVAFVQTPHDFYNLDSFQNRVDQSRARIWSEQLLFFRVIQAGKDRLNSAFFCGSCAVVRRAALDEIGGVATGTVTEDIHTSLRLHKRGWTSVYLAQSLAYGLAPSTASSFLKQRLRWGQGAMQTWRREGLLTSSGLSVAQKLSYLATLLAYFEGWQRLILFFSPFIVLVTGIMPIAALDEAFLIRFIPYFVLNFWVFEEVGRGYARTLLTEQYTMTRFAVFIVATFGFFLRKLRFVVTPKTMGEKEPTGRTMWPQMLVLSLNIVAVPVGLWLYFQGGHLPPGALVANVIWATMTASLAALAVRHAFRVANYRRREYRFPVPVPFALSDAPEDKFWLVTDVSPAGCRITGPGVSAFKTGEHIYGSLLLPNGDVRVHAVLRSALEVRDDNGISHEGAGCEFVWDDASDKAVLELFLYGSDLQLCFSGLTDRRAPPIERVISLFQRSTEKDAFKPDHWVPLLYRKQGINHRKGVAYLSSSDAADAERRLISLDSFPEGTQLSAREIGVDGTRQVDGCIDVSDALNVLTPIHVYRWNT